MSVCGYSTVCDEADHKGRSEYRCSRGAAAGSEYCVLHDDSYLGRGSADTVRGALMEEIASAHRLVGFHLPAISDWAYAPSDPLYFEQCIFYGMVVFSKAGEERDLTFNNCRFAVGASFARGRFNQMVRFKAVKSDPKARFDFSQSKLADIQIIGSTISQSDFSFAEFSRARLFNTVFAGDVYLTDSILNDCTFIDVVFEKRARFVAAKFSRCVFKNLTFKSATFELSIFDSREMSTMDTDMSNVSLLDADLSGVKFSDRTRWDDDHRHRIYDARRFYADPTPGRFVGTLGVLRSLRNNHEYHLMYRDAGQFFVQEMDLKRKYSLRGDKLSAHRAPRRLFSLTGMYFWICGYGESFRRISFWIALLFGAALGGFALEAEMSQEAGSAYASLGGYEKAAVHLKRTLAAFFPLGGGELPDYVVRATSVPLLAALFIVIRRRLERKLRH